MAELQILGLWVAVSPGEILC